MMSMTFSQAKTEVKNSFEGGASFDLNWEDIFHQAAKILNSNINPRSSKRRVQLYGGLQADLPVMTCPSDVSKPAALYTGQHSFGGRTYRYQAPAAFFESSEVDRFTIDYINAQPFIFIRAQGGSALTLQSFSDPDDFGGDVDLAASQRTFLFDSNALYGTFTDSLYNVTWSFDDTLDLSEYGRGVALVPFEVADKAKIAAVRLKLLTDASNFFTLTSTADSIGDSFVNGWNLARFDLINKVATGTPIMSTMNSAILEIQMVTGESQTVTVDRITLHKTATAHFEYYTRKIFASAAGALKTKPDEEDDIINLEDEELDIFLYEVRRIVVQDATYDGIDSKESQRFDAELKRKYDLYYAEHPSSQMPMTYNISSNIGKEFDVNGDFGT